MQEIIIPLKKPYEKEYEISNMGWIRRIGSEKPLKPCISRGYHYVSLSHKGNVKRFSIHRLVAKHFLSNTLHKPQINHIDGNKNNNRVDNLEWCTQSENQQHRYNVLKKGIDVKNCYRAKRVICLEDGEIFYSIRELGRKIKFDNSIICKRFKNKEIVEIKGNHYKIIGKDYYYG